jgi:transposase
MDLTNEQWKLIEPLIPQPKWHPGGRGRPVREPRETLNGILWVLRTGAPWKDLPDRYPPYQTCHRRFQQWTRSGAFDNILRTLAEHLSENGGMDLSEAFVDASFSSAKKGAKASAKPSVAKDPRSWQLQTALVFLTPSTWGALRRTK